MKPTTILVVDDAEATRYAVVRHLSRAGYATREAGTAREARELIKHQPDLVILDVNLPDGLGYDVCREIKANPDTSAVPVLHISATFQMSSDRVRGLESGADGFLTGPVEPDELLANVRLLLRLREANASLRKARERLDAVLSSITDVYFSLDNNGRFLELNAAAERAFGVAAGALIGRLFCQVFPNATDNIFYTTFHGALREQAPVHSEGYSAAGQGWFEAHVYPRDGYVETYARDISERKETEEALGRERERLSLALSAGQMGAYEFEFSHDALWWSPETYRLFGVDPARFKPSRQSFSELVHPDDRNRLRDALEASVRQRTTFVHQFRVVRPNGVVRWIGCRAQSEYDAAGTPLRQFGIAVDTTEQKYSEQKLEQMVADRTRKLREVVTELESFSYTIAHDMRAPLRSMQGFSDILLREHSRNLDSEAHAFLRRISSAAGRMDKLIQDVLNYSRLVRSELPLEAVNLDRLLADVIDTYPSFAPEHAEIMIDGSLPTVLGNEAMLTQVLSNLLGNAVKFVAPGAKPRIQVSAQDAPPNPTARSGPASSWQQEAQHVRILLQDNGIGIAADQQRKIFAVFQRVDKKYEGNGIGLAIVKKAVEKMGGQVGLHSEPGIGSTFWFELQRASSV